MLRRSISLRKAFLRNPRRQYRASAHLSGDALDMTDTFSRRHSKCCDHVDFGSRGGPFRSQEVSREQRFCPNSAF